MKTATKSGAPHLASEMWVSRRLRVLPLMLMLSATAFAAPKPFDATQYGAKPDGNTLNTAAIQAAAYSNATLDNFKLDHLDRESQTAGTIADGKNWKLEDNKIVTTDGTKLQMLAPGAKPAREGTTFGDK